MVYKNLVYCQIDAFHINSTTQQYINWKGIQHCEKNQSAFQSSTSTRMVEPLLIEKTHYELLLQK